MKRLEDIVSRMKDLAKNRGDASRRSRRERASQRGTFRELCNIVEVGGPPGAGCLWVWGGGDLAVMGLVWCGCLLACLVGML